MVLRRGGRWALVLALAAASMVWAEAPVSARHNFSILEVSPTQAAPGEEITVSGFSYTETAVVRFNSFDGPVLAELEPSDNNDIHGTVRIPPGTAAGRHIILAMHEDPPGSPSRFPGMAAVTVVGAAGAPLDLLTGLEVEARPVGLVTADAVSLRELTLTAFATVGVLGTASVLLFWVLSRRRGQMGAQR